ncbi:hypothetical protein [uncultured Pontibacter sp.]|uniref:hypothetical protein n=1 Tax=uncultured Pontibacter sp. TaxID=453356 RepID=UPI002623E396|nr:hypothetical protein [uncultured Pontibacter sp.]
MKFRKLVAALIVSISLYSCTCEDVHLGKVELTGELIPYLPAEIGPDNKYVIRSGDTKLLMYYHASDGFSPMKILVRETGKTQTTGKLGTYNCKEYYSGEERAYWTYVEGILPVSIMMRYTKDANQHGFNDIKNKEQVADVILFTVGFDNKFPTTVTRGMGSYDNLMLYRTFTLAKDPTNLIYKHSDITQEFVPIITLNGVQHQNVYHLYLNSPQYTADETYFLKHYPLDYIKGIYIKEGIGIVQAYTADGKQIDITQ